MDREKLKLIIRNMDLLLDALKSEVYSEPEAYTRDYPQITDYDEVFDDDDGYPD
jgi:hypothetical protein